MATLRTVILPGKVARDGRHKVRIAVSHNGLMRYIVTEIVIDSAREFKNGQVVKRPDANMLNTKLRGILQKYQNALDELEYIEGLTCPELIFQLKTAGRDKHRTFSSVYNEYMEFAKIKASTRKTYYYVHKSATEFFGENFLIERLTHSTLLGLEKHMSDSGLCVSTVNSRMKHFIAIINYARKCGYVEYRIDPLKSYEVPQPEVRDSWLTVDDVRRIRDMEIKKRNVADCRDLFMLSYYLGGINLIDLQKIDFNKQSENIHYVRTKTEGCNKLNKFVEFTIPAEAIEIIERHKDGSGRVFAKWSNHSTYSNMKKIVKALDLPQLIYYSARKSFAQHAFDLGVPTSTIDFVLGHKVNKASASIYNYICVTPELATQAVRKVLDNLKNA